MGDIARRFGIHMDYLALGHATCAHREEDCKQDVGGMDPASCQIVVARFWCETYGYDCSKAALAGDVVPCMKEIYSRACNDLDRPVECPPVKKAGLTIIPSAWPDGPVVDPMPPFQPW